MKRQMKWVAGIVAIALAVSTLALPQRAHAQGQTLSSQQGIDLVRKHEAIRDLEMHREEMLTSIKKASVAKKAQVNSADVVNATSVTYTGTTAPLQDHYYSFEVVTGGLIVVNTDGFTNYLIFNLETGKVVSNYDTIDPGFYTLIVFSTEETRNYRVQLLGVTFNGTPDMTLPTLSVTSFTGYLARLNKGIKTFKLEGSATGATMVQYWINDTNHEPVNLDTTFSEDIDVPSGYNTILIYAEGSNGNGIAEKHAIFSPSIERMAGTDRYATSVEISKRMPILSDTVVITTGMAFPDALSGGPLAAWYGAPILLTQPAGLSEEVKQEIMRRKAKHAIILGGEGAVSTTVADELNVLGITSIDRIAGADRFETSAKIANALLNAQDQEFGKGAHNPVAFVVTGTNYADALSASAPAGKSGTPILLVKSGSIPTPILNVITDNQLIFFDIVGGTGAVSANVQNQLTYYAGINGDVIRHAGSNRYETALAVAKYFTDQSNFYDTTYMLSPYIIHVAYGNNYPDALSQGPLASMMKSPLLLTKTSDLEPSVKTFLINTKPGAFYISGGTGVVSTNVENTLYSYIPQ